MALAHKAKKVPSAALAHAPGHAHSPLHALKGLTLAEQKQKVSPGGQVATDVDEEEDDDEERQLASAKSATARARFRYSGEPLPWLKEIVQGKLRKTPKGNLRAFLDMVRQATVRPKTGGARTFISPADGMASIITGVVINIVEKYRELATPGQQRVLNRVLTDHLKLLEKPMSGDGRGGGHRVEGVRRSGDGLAGPALNHGHAVRLETVNQTAVVLLALQRILDNPDFAGRHDRVEKLVGELTPEFKSCLLRCYRGRDVSKWRYGLSSRPEDQSHLKTTWDMLVKLSRTKAKAAKWYKTHADRIERLWPRVAGPWEGLSNQAGSLH